MLQGQQYFCSPLDSGTHQPIPKGLPPAKHLPALKRLPKELPAPSTPASDHRPSSAFALEYSFWDSDSSSAYFCLASAATACFSYTRFRAGALKRQNHSCQSKKPSVTYMLFWSEECCAKAPVLFLPLLFSLQGPSAATVLAPVASVCQLWRANLDASRIVGACRR